MWVTGLVVMVKACWGPGAEPPAETLSPCLPGLQSTRDLCIDMQCDDIIPAGNNMRPAYREHTLLCLRSRLRCAVSCCALLCHHHPSPAIAHDSCMCKHTLADCFRCAARPSDRLLPAPLPAPAAGMPGGAPPAAAGAAPPPAAAAAAVAAPGPILAVKPGGTSSAAAAPALPGKPGGTSPSMTAAAAACAAGDSCCACLLLVCAHKPAAAQECSCADTCLYAATTCTGQKRSKMYWSTRDCCGGAADGTQDWQERLGK